METDEMTPEQKAWIDNATYEMMLERVRYAPVGDPLFVRDTEVSKYFDTRCAQLRKEVGDAGHTAASKRIGWG